MHRMFGVRRALPARIYPKRQQRATRPLASGVAARPSRTPTACRCHRHNRRCRSQRRRALLEGVARLCLRRLPRTTTPLPPPLRPPPSPHPRPPISSLATAAVAHPFLLVARCPRCIVVGTRRSAPPRRRFSHTRDTRVAASPRSMNTRAALSRHDQPSLPPAPAGQFRFMWHRRRARPRRPLIPRMVTAPHSLLLATANPSSTPLPPSAPVSHSPRHVRR